ncbi:MAG TPA: hypothetical protein DCM40_33410, partial [Maribacter sp.]|nr:hypothetical protein [Maribacter sp.]
FRVTTIKGKAITQKETNKLNKLLNDAVQTGSVPKASALLVKGFMELAGESGSKDGEGPKNPKQSPKN